MRTPAIETRGLVRSFGSVRALAGLDLTIPAGEIVALVGPNGAGKTTLLLVLSGLLGADSGTVSVAGADPAVNPKDVHRSIGWMPDFFGVYEGLTVQEYLELFGALYHLGTNERAARARDLLHLVRLEEFAERPVHVLSRGQKQRLGFARALVHSPTILLLDEPASGLDPRARVELRELIRNQRDAGVTVVVSSHILAELEEMSDSVVFMEGGRSRGYHKIDQLPDLRTGRSWRVRALDAAALAAATDARTTLPDGSVIVDVASDADAAQLLERLVQSGVGVVEFVPERSDLESAFLGLDEANTP